MYVSQNDHACTLHYTRYFNFFSREEYASVFFIHEITFVVEQMSRIICVTRYDRAPNCGIKW